VLAIPAPFALFATPVQATVDAFAAGGQAPFGALATPIEPVVDPLAAMFQPCGTPRVPEGDLVRGAPVEARFGAVATAIHPMLDALATTVHPVFDAVAAAIEPVLDAIALVGGKRRSRGQQQQGAGEGG
jgi:hypothetical protein